MGSIFSHIIQAPLNTMQAIVFFVKYIDTLKYILGWRNIFSQNSRKHCSNMLL